MLGAIFYVKGVQRLTDDRVGIDLILLASSLVIIITSTGKISIAHAIKKVSKCIH